MKVGIVGGSGYTGAELLRICAGHPDLDVAHIGADAAAGSPVAELYPHLAAAYPGARFGDSGKGAVSGLDLVFLALPHGVSGALMESLVGKVGVLIDLSADFRLTDPAVYSKWYRTSHPAPQLLGTFVYGLPELFRPSLVGAERVAVPGCYPTSAALALAPLVRAGTIEASGVIVDAASGASGAGRKPSHDTQFAHLNEDFRAYNLQYHRHTPEIEQATGAQILFTPHLAPMTRGILATCYARPAAKTSTGELLALLADAYRGEPFITVASASPSTKATLGSNVAHLSARYDERTGWVMVLCALDNLVKGAAGQAVQCANLALGLPETRGLPNVGVYP